MAPLGLRPRRRGLRQSTSVSFAAPPGGSAALVADDPISVRARWRAGAGHRGRRRHRRRHRPWRSPAGAAGSSPSTSTSPQPRRPPRRASTPERPWPRPTTATWPIADAVGELAERVALEHGALDVLVNNAGVGVTGELLGMTLADWEWIRSVNLDGVVHCLMAFGPAMVEQRSRSGGERLVGSRLRHPGDRTGLRHHQGRRHRPVAVRPGRLGPARRRCLRRVPGRHRHRRSSSTPGSSAAATTVRYGPGRPGCSVTGTLRPRWPRPSSMPPSATGRSSLSGGRRERDGSSTGWFPPPCSSGSAPPSPNPSPRRRLTLRDLRLCRWRPAAAHDRGSHGERSVPMNQRQPGLILARRPTGDGCRVRRRCILERLGPPVGSGHGPGSEAVGDGCPLLTSVGGLPDVIRTPTASRSKLDL